MQGNSREHPPISLVFLACSKKLRRWFHQDSFRGTTSWRLLCRVLVSRTAYSARASASAARLTAIKTYYLCCLFNRLNPPRNPIPINIPKGKFLLLIQITFPKEYLLQSSYCCYCLVLFCFPFYSKKTFSSRFSLAFYLICGLLALRL